MRLELELPEAVSQKITALPLRSDSQYMVNGGPIEHLAHTREYLLSFYFNWVKGGGVLKSLETRNIPLNSLDMLYMSFCGGFKRDNDIYTVNWEYLEKEGDSLWSRFYETGDDKYMWWQISKMLPEFKLGPFGLWCIETNRIFNPTPTVIRSDSNSDFDLIFATNDEIASLKKQLGKFKSN